MWGYVIGGVAAVYGVYLASKWNRWPNIFDFMRQAFSEGGVPSSSRIINAWLSVSSMTLIWFIVKHMMGQPLDKLQVWIGGLPMVIGALAAFAVSPYGVNQMSKWFKKDSGNPPQNGDTDGGSKG